VAEDAVLQLAEINRLATSLREKRDELNTEAQQLVKERDKLNAQVAEWLSKARDHREKETSIIRRLLNSK
jgi:uncharacterized coiled-coil DUF342 family protein